MVTVYPGFCTPQHGARPTVRMLNCDATAAGSFVSTALEWSPVVFAADVVAWWDMSDASTLTTGGGLVTAIADLSGNGFTLSTLGTAPAYDATAMNGYPTAVFTAASNQALATSASLVLAQPFTVVTLFKTNTLLGSIPIVWDGDIAAVSGTRALILSEDNVHGGQAEVYAGSIDYLGFLANNTVYLFVNEFSGPSSQHTINGGTPTAGSPGVGGIENGFRWSTLFEGDISFCIIINRVLTTDERQSLEWYVTSRYGL